MECQLFCGACLQPALKYYADAPKAKTFLAKEDFLFCNESKKNRTPRQEKKQAQLKYREQYKGQHNCGGGRQEESKWLQRNLSKVVVNENKLTRKTALKMQTAPENAIFCVEHYVGEKGEPIYVILRYMICMSCIQSDTLHHEVFPSHTCANNLVKKKLMGRKIWWGWGKSGLRLNPAVSVVFFAKQDWCKLWFERKQRSKRRH